jgi:hypothetical protein
MEAELEAAARGEKRMVGKKKNLYLAVMCLLKTSQHYKNMYALQVFNN